MSGVFESARSVAADIWAALLGVDTACRWVLAALGGLAAFLFPSEAAIFFAVSAGTLIALDTVTGLLATISEGNPITSPKSRRVFYKLFGYSTLVTVARFVGEGIPLSVPGATKEMALLGAAYGVCWMLGFIILTEAISVIENVRRMGVNSPLVLTRRLKRVLDDKYKDGDEENGNQNSTDRGG
jgi:phage-related holin